jgi:hypothetical protein
MTRFTPNSQLRFDTEVRNSEGSLVDPDTITFVWRSTRMGSDHTETVTKDGTGLYHAFATPTEGGAFFGEFRCTNPAVVIPVEQYIEPSHFASTYDPYWA